MTVDYHALQERAIANARGKTKPGSTGYGMCLKEVRECYGIDAKFRTAAEAWAGAKIKHPVTRANANSIPRGVPVFWTGGSESAGHIAISLGDGLCETTDFVTKEAFGVARIADIGVTRWRGLVLKGWAPEVNGQTVYTQPAPEPRIPPTPAPVDPKKVPQATHYEEFVLGVRALWAAHGQHIQKKYKARRHAAEMALEDVNAGPPIRKGVRK